MKWKQGVRREEPLKAISPGAVPRFKAVASLRRSIHANFVTLRLRPKQTNGFSLPQPLVERHDHTLIGPQLRFAFDALLIAV